MLGQVRPRPKANKAISASNPHFGHHQSAGGGGGLDFLDRLEGAEARDAEWLEQMQQQQLQHQQKGHRAFQKRAADGSIMCDDGGFCFGDDSVPQTRNSRNMYQTSSGATNQAMKEVHEAAKQQAHEATIRQLLTEQGYSQQQIQQEILLWRRELASGAAAPIPDSMEEAAAMEAGGKNVFAAQPVGQRTRGESGQFIRGDAFEDPFKVRTGRAPQKSKPWDIDAKPDRNGLGAQMRQKKNAWDIDDAFKQRDTGAPQINKKKNAWDIDDAFKQRGSPPQHNGFNAQGMAAGGAAMSRPEMTQGGFSRDANQSSISGGIFG